MRLRTRGSGVQIPQAAFLSGNGSGVKEKLALIAFGTVLGLAAVAVLSLLLLSYRQQLPEGAVFASVAQLHESMLGRDSRDVGPDRSVSLRSIITPHPAERIMYDLLPHLDVRFQGVPLVTNSCGMRGPERQSQRAHEAIYRIALLGDSFAFGWGVDYEESFGAVLERDLGDYFAGDLEFEVLNFGIPGYSTFQEAALFLERGLAFQPDAVLVYYVTNDVQPPFFITDLNRSGSLVDSGQFSRRFWARESAVVAQHDQLAALLDPNRRLKELNQVLEPLGIPLLVAINPGRRWQEDRKLLWYARPRYGVQLIPLAEELERVVRARAIPTEAMRLPNDPHPNALRHRLLGAIMAAHMSIVVEQSWRLAPDQPWEPS